VPPEQCAGVDRAHTGGDELSTVARRQNDVAVLDLALARVAAQLPDRFCHAGEVAEVIAGEQAPAGIDWNAAAWSDGAGFDERPALAFLAEAIVLELEQHLGGEAVVELAAVDVVKRE